MKSWLPCPPCSANFSTATRWVGRRSGRTGQASPPEQQKEFLGLFRELLQRTYVQKLLLFENPNFIYAGEQLTSAGPVIDTKIVTPRDQFDVTYRLRPQGDTWQATAITVEDVSLTANLGSQLNNLLSRMSIDDLLTLMRRKYGNANGAAQS
jgi:phospholipid transport system substrate-binding protein